ncbi:MAG: hypothetical protein JWO12_3155 [Frankiales bacterium]|jgi:hypothetical protein|nr:hypothetical protein [Frankiales bacterium]
MKLRLLTAAAVSGSLALTVTGAHAATPVLDGKKVKTLTLSASPAAQDHDADLVTDLAKDPLGGGPDRAQCTAPRCGALTFVYKPAKGVKGSTGFRISWATPGDDMDLYVAEVVKGQRSTLAHCGATGGTSETLVLPAGTLVAGHTYALVTDYYRITSDKLTAQVSFPSAVTAKTTVPASVDQFGPVDCGL